MKALEDHIMQSCSIDKSELALICRKFREKSVSKNVHFLEIGEGVKEVYFIISGCVRTYIYDYEGVEHNISFSMEDWWFGDLQSFIKNSPASFSIQALEDCKVLSINKSDWDFLIAESSNFSTYTRTLFRNTLFAQENRIVQNLSYSAEERYHKFMKDYPKLSQRIAQKQIARYLGITPEFLSMIRRRQK
ncbi:MAG: Crp/Fnr family transcriptional regulator [Bacteroidota bacterium]